MPLRELPETTVRWIAANIRFHAQSPEWAILFYKRHVNYSLGIMDTEDAGTEAFRAVESMTEDDTKLPEDDPVRDAIMRLYVLTWSLGQHRHGVPFLESMLEELLEECVHGGVFPEGKCPNWSMLVENHKPNMIDWATALWKERHSKQKDDETA